MQYARAVDHPVQSHFHEEGKVGCHCRSMRRSRSTLHRKPTANSTVNQNCGSQKTPDLHSGRTLSHTRAVAAEHYLQVTDAHFDRAAGALQNAVQHPAAKPCNEVNGEPSEVDPEPVFSEVREHSVACTVPESTRMSRVGFEPTSKRL